MRLFDDDDLFKDAGKPAPRGLAITVLIIAGIIFTALAALFVVMAVLAIAGGKVDALLVVLFAALAVSFAVAGAAAFVSAFRVAMRLEGAPAPERPLDVRALVVITAIFLLGTIGGLVMLWEKLVAGVGLLAFLVYAVFWAYGAYITFVLARRLRRELRAQTPKRDGDA